MANKYGGKWYPATIVSINKDGTFDIKWDDVDEEEGRNKK